MTGTVHAELIALRRTLLGSQIRELRPETPKPLILEIGSGHGHFLTAYALAHPGHWCVGVDLCSDRIERALRKQQRAAAGNLQFLHADANDFLAALPAGLKFASAYFLFPDPWPKRRHHKHRLLRADFLTRLAGRAGEGARIYFRTDHAPYFADTQRELRISGQWTVVPEPWPFELVTVFQERAGRYDSLVAVPRVVETLPAVERDS